MWREKGGKVVGGWHLQYANIPQGTRHYTICSNKIVKIKCCSGRVLTRINFQGACHSGFGMVSALFCTIADEESLLSGPESLSLPFMVFWNICTVHVLYSKTAIYSLNLLCSWRGQAFQDLLNSSKGWFSRNSSSFVSKRDTFNTIIQINIKTTILRWMSISSLLAFENLT